MTLVPAEQPTEEAWVRATVSTFVGLILGIFNQAIISSLLIHSTLAPFVGYAVGGMIASAIQGAFWRRFIHQRVFWISVSAIAWMLIAFPVLWFPRGDFELWLCHYVVRRAVVGAASGGVVGGAQALVLRQRLAVAGWWIIMNMLVWAVVYILPALLFDNYMLVGEGSCLD